MHTWWPNPREPVWINTVISIDMDAEAVGALAIEQLLDCLDLQEVVAAAERSELIGAALARSVGHRRRVCAIEAATALDHVEIVRFAGAVRLDQLATAAREDRVELGARERELAAAAVAARDRAADVVDDPLAHRLEVLARQLARQQPHAAVDVEADAARRDRTVGDRGRGDAADRESVALVHVGHAVRGPNESG